MEGSFEKQDGSDVAKKSRSLDLHSIIVEKSRVSALKRRSRRRDLVHRDKSEPVKRTGRATLEVRGSFSLESRHKRSRKEVSLSSFQPFAKRHRNSLNASRPRPNGLVSGVGKPENNGSSSNASHDLCNLSDDLHELAGHSDDSLSDKKDHRSQTTRKSKTSNGLGDNIVIPKRPRGLLKRKKPEGLMSSKRAVHDAINSCKSSVNSRTSKLSTDLVLPSLLSNGKQKKRSKESRVSGYSWDSSRPRKKDENGGLVQVSSTKVRSRKTKGSTGEKQTHVGDPSLVVDADEKSCADSHDDDDEENLEQNAARMLSSRFDPSCTGFSGKRTASSSKSTNESSLLQSLCGKFKRSHPVPEISPVDVAGRVLRPRRRNGKGFARKRRHFYEVCSRDVDPYSVLKQRIRVFWPLDRSWYFGLVKDYDPTTKMHYIKYDDRDEEWINLQNERFKLLRFPSEVSTSFNSANLRLESEKKMKSGDKKTIDLKSAGSFAESEPIITWLMRSTRPMKSSPASILKKQRRADLMKDEPSTLLARKGDTAVSPSIIISSKFSSSCIVPEGLANRNSSDMPVLKNETDTDGKRLSFVYSRRRFRNRREGLDVTLEQDSACATEAGPISFLATAADGAAALEALNSSVSSVKSQQVMLKLMIPLDCIQDLSSGANSSWLCRSNFLLHYGKLMHLWPMVHMEAIFVDTIMGLRFLTFEGCLRQAAALVCFITTTFCQHNEGGRFIEQQMPSTSIGFKLSGLDDQRRHLLFVLFSFLVLENSKWRYLEHKLKQQCLEIREIKIADCTSANIKNLPSGHDQILHTSVLGDRSSIMCLPERSCSDIMNQLIPNESANIKMNPTVCYFAEKFGRNLPCSVSLVAEPSFFLSLHLKLLMEKNDTLRGFRRAISVCSEECPGNDKLTDDDCSPVEDSSDQVSEITLENVGFSLSQAAVSSGCLASGCHKVESDALSVSSDGDCMKSSHKTVSGECIANVNNVGHRDLGSNGSDETIIELQRIPCHVGSCRGVKKSGSSLHEDSSSPDKSEGACNSLLNIDVQIQELDQMKEQSFTEVMNTTNMVACKMIEQTVCSPSTAAPRGIWNYNRQGSVSPSFRHHSNLLQDDFLPNGFAFSSRKPRTQVSYSLPFGSYELGSKPRSHHHNRQPYKKIRADNTKRMLSISGNSQSYLESLTCDANILVTVSDRGWRECGAQVVLDSDDQKDWRLSVKVLGDTKYTHKAHQFLQPGTTNRYTHAMMWRGGKDWILEFTDRSQWTLFKEMHEECYNRNLRAASVKNIPTPGVRLIEDPNEGVDMPFIRSSHKYIRQVGTDIDMALDPSHVLYDMDSSDEEWIANLRHSLDDRESDVLEVTDDMFERVMDMFEKFAYAQSCDEFTSDEIEEYMAEVGPVDIIKSIYEHWWKKRQKKGLPLIRQFQPALWECYEQQLKDWELTLSKMHSPVDGCQDKACFPQKPPMFAFCLRPRGLEVPNKGSKQRSHKKFMYAGHQNSFAREQDTFHAYGRKLNGCSAGEEKALVVGIPNYESSDLLHWRQSPPSFSPRDASRAGALMMNSDSSEGSPHPMRSRNNSKKMGMFLSPRDPLMMPFLHNQKTKRNGVYGAELCEWPSRKQSQPDGFVRHRADIDEFRLRDASSAAQHASNMAKLKKEKAQWLLHKADLALHKAMVALMTAEAIEASEKDLIGDG